MYNEMFAEILGRFNSLLSVYITLYKTYIDPLQRTHWFEALNWGNFKIIRGYFSPHTPHLIPITGETRGIIITLEQGYAMPGLEKLSQNRQAESTLIS